MSGWGERIGRLYPVLLAGGAGTALWPVSRALYPKQFQALAGERSLLQQAASWLHGRPDVAPPTVVCHNEHRFIVTEQLAGIGVPPFGVLLEPAGHGSAPAAVYAALMMRNRDPQAVMALLPADRVLGDSAGLVAAIDAGLDRVLAGEVLAIGRGAWLARADALVDAIERQQPKIVEACREAVRTGTRDMIFFRLATGPMAECPSALLADLFADAPPAGAAVDWTSLKGWDDLWSRGARDGDGNVAVGDVAATDSSGCYLRGQNALVATLGLKDMIVVQTDDAVLVAPRDRAGEIPAMVRGLKATNRPQVDVHSRLHRPWGHIDSLGGGSGFDIRQLTVRPGASLALQLHHHRAKHWVVVGGTARITRGDQVVVLAENQSIFIPKGVSHRVQNPGKLPLVMVQVQTGDYFGADDVVRLEEPYRQRPAQATARPRAPAPAAKRG